MKEFNFLPLWYRNKVDKRNYLRFKICLIIMFIAITINVCKFVNSKNNIYKTNLMIESNIKKKSNEKFKNQKDLKNRLVTIKKYKDFVKNTHNKFDFNVLNIEDGKIYLEKDCKDSLELNNLLETIESNSKYKIDYMDIENLNKNRFLIKLKLEEKGLE